MRVVFNTANADAVGYFLRNIEGYLRAHPEIDIFDCWPPDVAKWAQSPAMAALGPAVDRQARLMNAVDSVARRVRPGLKVEIIAYGQVLEPPMGVELSATILVDLCPINQSFEAPLYDTSMTANGEYFRAAEDWRRHFAGDRSVYSYYRKYAWRSLPVVLPHFMQQELRWYASMGFRGISTYAEPGDWFTYGLNHYVLAGLAWDPGAPVDMMMDEYSRALFGDARGAALEAYRELERVVRGFGSIPYTRLKPAAELDSAAAVLKRCRARVDSAEAGNGGVAASLRRLRLMLDYAIGDLEILKLRATGAGATAVEARIKELVELLERHRGEGLFVLRDGDNLGLFLNHYNSLK
jgi:hypothetical protein